MRGLFGRPGWSDVEGAGGATAPAIPCVAVTAARTAAAALAVAAVDDDRDVRVVFVVFDEAAVRFFAEFGRHDAVDHGSLSLVPPNGSTWPEESPEERGEGRDRLLLPVPAL